MQTSKVLISMIPWWWVCYVHGYLKNVVLIRRYICSTLLRYMPVCTNSIGANCTVPNLETLSCVPSGNCYLPEMSRIFKVAAPELG